MSSIFDNNTNREVTQGLDRGILYTRKGSVIWHGLVSVEVEYTDVEQSILYIDGDANRIQAKTTDFKATAVCYNYPDELELSPFGFVYRVYTDDPSYELHIVYGCRAQLDRLQVVSLSEEAGIPYFSIGLTTKPERMPINGYVPSSQFILRSKHMKIEALEAIEKVLYGTETEDPRLPPLSEVVDILETYVALRITDHGDGTWSAEEINTHGIIKMVDNTEFSITWDSAKYIDDQVYTIESL